MIRNIFLGILLLCILIFGYLLVGAVVKVVLFNHGYIKFGYEKGEFTQTRKTVYRVMAIFWLPLLPVFLIMIILNLLSDIFKD